MKRILIIDDSSTVRLYHRSILESAGYAADEAINGMEGLEKALTTPYALYLVDVNMPRLDGYSFVRELRSHTAIAQAPSIMISTEAGALDETKAYEAGANLYLVKPMRPEILLPYVRVLLGESGP